MTTREIYNKLDDTLDAKRQHARARGFAQAFGLHPAIAVLTSQLT
jgi:hypothetical protein